MRKLNDKKIEYKGVIPVFFAVDDFYASCLSVAIRSLIDNASKDYEYRIYILITKLSLKNRNRLAKMATANTSITFVDVAKEVDKLGEKLHLRDYYTKATYYRFFVPRLFPEYDRGIYLDCDIVVLGDVSEMYFSDLGDNYIAGVSDDVIASCQLFIDYAEKIIDVPHETYVNAGVLLMNLKALRQADFEARFVELMNTRSFPVAQDQDYLNVLCHDKIKYLPRGWNVAPFPNNVHDYPLNLIHYKLNMKPWHYNGVRFEDHFWQYAARTSYLSDLLDMRDNFSTDDVEEDNRHSEHLVALVAEELEKAAVSFTSPLRYMMKNDAV